MFKSGYTLISCEADLPCPQERHCYTRTTEIPWEVRVKSVTEMKIRLMEEFEEQMPETTKFGIGYIEGRQSTKRWICCDDDIDAM